MDQTGTYVTIMQESLLRKKKYLEQVLSLTEEQERIAKEKKFDEEAFGEIIDNKDVLINNINEIDKGFTSVYDRVRAEVLANQDLYHDELVEMQNRLQTNTTSQCQMVWLMTQYCMTEKNKKI